MIGKYNVITLCGSTKFKDEFIYQAKRLTLEGNIVLNLSIFGHSEDVEVWKDNTKEMLDDMHLRKIDICDKIFVVNVGGYIGEATRKEIDYAVKNNKEVIYLEPLKIKLYAIGYNPFNVFSFSDEFKYVEDITGPSEILIPIITNDGYTYYFQESDENGYLNIDTNKLCKPNIPFFNFIVEISSSGIENNIPEDIKLEKKIYIGPEMISDISKLIQIKYNIKEIKNNDIII